MNDQTEMPGRLHCEGCKDHGPFAPEPQCMGVAQTYRRILPPREVIADIIGGYAVHMHYNASARKGATARKYAVFQRTPPGQPARQVSEPKTHAEAHTDMREIMADAILAELAR